MLLALVLEFVAVGKPVLDASSPFAHPQMKISATQLGGLQMGNGMLLGSHTP